MLTVVLAGIVVVGVVAQRALPDGPPEPLPTPAPSDVDRLELPGWERITEPAALSSHSGGALDVVTVGERFVVLGPPGSHVNGHPRPAFWRSDDGRTWRAAASVDDGDARYSDAGLTASSITVTVAEPAGRLVAVGSANFEPPAQAVAWVSDDAGDRWDLVPVSVLAESAEMHADYVFAHTDGLFARGGNFPIAEPIYWTSRDGTAWEPVRGGRFAGRPVDELNVSDVASQGDISVVVGTDLDSDVALTVRGNETLFTADFGGAAVVAGKRGFVVVGTRMVARRPAAFGMTSPDGLTWTEIADPHGVLAGEQLRLSGVAQDGDRIVAVGRGPLLASIWEARQVGGVWEWQRSVSRAGYSADEFASIAANSAGAVVVGTLGPMSIGDTQELGVWFSPAAE